MVKINLLLLSILFFSCSDNNPDMGDINNEFVEKILGGWQLERIRVEGADCKFLFGDDVPDEYLADEVGCAKPLEILGNASRCINLEFMADGQATFFWSEFSSQSDANITYEIVDNEVRYCLVSSSCSGFYRLVGNNLETESELTLDDDCSAIYVLRRK
ncbi:MAG: hypothetical protein HKN51_11895 [Saprospiraceae bacterium]|nr:hypothetical protein [Saprospiraceae bacterium]